MDVKKRRIVEWGHLILICAMAAIMIGYLIDTRSVSLKLNNLMLVQPAALFGLVLIALILPQIFPKVSEDDVPDAALRREKKIEVARVALLTAAFGVFVFSLETFGFDVATFVFVAIALYICGERKYWLIGTYSLIFTIVVVLGYQQLVPYPFPMTFL
ncbi:MAG: tripartite tricarboxylate transporter TctB family protein [Hyphomicrobiales bacterium]